MYSLNQIVKVLNNIASDHYQINSFGYGRISSLPEKSDKDYPVLWCDTKPSQLIDREFQLRMDVAIFDLLTKDEDNYQEVLSDTLQIALDVVAQLTSKDYNDNFIIQKTASLQDFMSRFADNVAGWLVTITIKIPYTADKCALPSSDAESE
jgi:hypothetical protein